MIYEMRTYDLKPRSLAEVEKRFAEAYEKRRTYSEKPPPFHRCNSAAARAPHV